MFSQVGNIVLIKNVIFKRSDKNDRMVIDHAYKTGRPALVICETDEKIYHLLLTHSHNDDDFKNGRYFPVINSNGDDNGYIDFSEIHARPLCYEKEYEYMEDEDFHDILVAFCTYQETYYEDDEYEKIRPYIYNLIKELNYEDEKCLKK